MHFLNKLIHYFLLPLTIEINFIYMDEENELNFEKSNLDGWFNIKSKDRLKRLLIISIPND